MWRVRKSDISTEWSAVFPVQLKGKLYIWLLVNEHYGSMSNCNNKCKVHFNLLDAERIFFSSPLWGRNEPVMQEFCLTVTSTIDFKLWKEWMQFATICSRIWYIFTSVSFQTTKTLNELCFHFSVMWEVVLWKPSTKTDYRLQQKHNWFFQQLSRGI